MTDRIYKQNVYSLREPMWHSKGVVGQEEENAMSVYRHMLPVAFEQRPFSISLNGGTVESNKHFGIVRVGGNTEKIIGQSKGRYNLTQPEKYAQLFDAYVQKPVETMGFLGTSGERMFTTWSLPQIDVHGDIVKMFGFLAVGFDGKFGEKLFETGVRVVCSNTWSMAVADSQEKRGGAAYSAKHNMKDHEERLGIWMRYITKQAEENVAIYQSLFRKMEETPVTVDVAYNLFAKVYPKKNSLGDFHPDELRGKDQGKIDLLNQSQEEKRDLAIELFKGAGVEIGKTLWGTFNVITELENHHIPSKKDKTESILLGNRQGIMQEALLVMSEYVENR